MAIVTIIGEIPQAGHRGVDVRDTFVTKQEAFQDKLTDSTVDEMNAVGSEMNATASQVNSDATDAESSAVEAADSASSALAGSNNKGNWSALTGALNIPASVNHNDSVWMLNVNLADVTLSEPTDVNSDWTEISVNQADLDLKADKDNPAFIGSITEETAAMPADEINPTNGTIQTKTMAGDETWTEALADGQSLIIHLTSAGFTVSGVWDTLTWVGGSQPILSTVDAIVFYKIGATLFGKHLGEVS
ncbi:MAG: hypothetical protein U9O83_02520 [Campylobacterota bacterium]|nr:hypothetical protein [Campylobacterota bacterium]